jgi:hypothetical protein
MQIEKENQHQYSSVYDLSFNLKNHEFHDSRQIPRLYDHTGLLSMHVTFVLWIKQIAVHLSSLYKGDMFINCM